MQPTPERATPPSELVRKLVDGAPITIGVVNELGTITFVSGATEAVFGYTADELIGTNMLDYVDLEWNPLAFESIGTALTEHGLRMPMLFRLITKGGGRQVVEVTANSQLDDPIVGGMLVYVRSWDEQSKLDDILESLAGNDPIERRLELFVEAMAGETLQSMGAVLYAPGRDGFGRVVAAPSLAPELASVPGPTTSPWELARATGCEQLIAVRDLPDHLRQSAERGGFSWCWAYPVRGSNGEVAACLVFWQPLDRPMEEGLLVWIRRLSRLTQLVLDQDESRARLTYQAKHDPLTGLFNRAAFFERFQDVLDDPQGGPMVGVLYLDLDGFKPVNDRLGHGAGDAVLVAIAHRLQRRLRHGDVLARMGGDEFAVLCPDVTTVEQVEALGRRLAATAREPISVSDHTVVVGASVGVCVAPVGSCSIDALVEAADAALYDTKVNDAGGCRVATLGVDPTT